MQTSQKDLRRKILGRKGEAIALRYLKRQGFRLLERNYRTPFGEADLVCSDRGDTVFVEVKARSSDSFGSPAEAVDFRKREKYRKIAAYYCSNGADVPIRFDVVEIFGKKINHIRDAF